LLCECKVCKSRNPKNKRLRSSVHLVIENEGQKTHIQIDTGPDFKEQMMRNRIPRIDAILYTHAHADHISGLDDIRRFNSVQKSEIPVFGNQGTMDALHDKFSYCFNPVQLGGGVPRIRTILAEGSFQINNVVIEPLPVYHGNLMILGYKIGDFAYVTDASKIPDEVMATLRGCDYVVLNALRYKPHPTHFNLEQALEIAGNLPAKRIFFTHMTHDMDHDKVNKILPRHIRLAYDGLVISF